MPTNANDPALVRIWSPVPTLSFTQQRNAVHGAADMAMPPLLVHLLGYLDRVGIQLDDSIHATATLVLANGKRISFLSKHVLWATTKWKVEKRRCQGG